MPPLPRSGRKHLWRLLYISLEFCTGLNTSLVVQLICKSSAIFVQSIDSGRLVYGGSMACLRLSEFGRIGGTLVVKQRFTKLIAASIWLTPGCPLIKSKLAKPSENRGVRCAWSQPLGAELTLDEPEGWRGHLSLQFSLHFSLQSSTAQYGLLAEEPVNEIPLVCVAAGAL
jgi:hypothetical protein